MTFQPFVVNCLTCGSALRVTDPSIVGTIASCPKCQSMVQITPASVPRQEPKIAVGHSSVDSEAITEDAIPGDEFADPLENRFNNEADPVTSTPRTPFADPGFSSKKITNSIPPAQAWQSERTARSRQIAMIVALGISGFLISGAVFGWFVSTWQRPAAMVPADQLDADGQGAGRPAVESADQQDTDVSAADIAAANPPANRSESESTSETETVPDAPAHATPAHATPAIADASSPIPTDLIPTSPLKAQPSDQAPTVDEIANPDLGSPENSSAGLMELPPELAKYTQILPRAGDLLAPTLQAPPTIDDVELDGPAEEDETENPQTKPRDLNLRRDLGIRLAISSSGYPLANLLLLAGQLTTVPLEIDWVSFDLANIDSGVDHTPPKGWQTARELLDNIATSLDCQWLEEETLLVLTPNDQRFNDAIATISDLADFTNDQESAITTLMKFLKPDSETPPTTLQIGTDRQQQLLAAIAIEALRRMRSIAPKVPDHKLSRSLAAWDASTIQWPILSGGDAGPPIHEPISVAGFLLNVSANNQAICLVNWHDLNRRGIGPETLLFPQTKADAATTLGEAFARWKIQIRSVDATTWWVGSEATYDRLPLVLWTSTLADRREIITERIQDFKAANMNDDVRFAYDPISDRALIRIPRYIARQMPKIMANP